MGHPVISVQQERRRPIYVQLRDTVEMGRECDGVLLDDPQASRRHVTLTPQGDTVIVEDLGSTNGTFLDGARVASPTVVGPGSVLQVGATVIRLAEDAAVRPREAGETPRGATVTADPASSGVPGGAVRAAGDGPTDVRETSMDAVAREVSRSQAPLKEVEHDHGTITIVFSDIESSTERATAMGDTAWMEVLAAHNEIIRRHVRTWRGTVVKNQGDGFMMTFDGARRALRAMIEVQEELDRLTESDPEEAVRVRVGVHTGEVISEHGDIFGKHVMFAARVGGLAEGGEILVSSIVREITSARGDLSFGEPRTVALKGIEGEHTVYPLRWRDAAAS